MKMAAAQTVKFLSLNPVLYDYLCRHRFDAQDPILADLRRETEALGEVRRMQVSAEQGALLTILVAAISAQTALEIGTFTGYSSLCIARGLRAGGRLLCLDQNREWTDIARRYWTRAGLAQTIELRLSDAIAALDGLASDLRFDFVFIDAEKTEYDAYYERVLPRVRENGLILFDNMLWGGRLGSGPIEDPAGRAIDALNTKLASDPRVEAVLLPIADGIQFCRKTIAEPL